MKKPTADRQEVFKKCPMCKTTWQSRDDFIKDTTLTLNGYQADFEQLEYGLFHFTHVKDDCCSTMVILTRDFLSLYTGERYHVQKTGSDECPGYCLQQDQLDRCTAFCEYAFVREVIHILRTGKEH